MCKFCHTVIIKHKKKNYLPVAKVFIHSNSEDDKCYVLVSHYCAAHCNLPEN